MERSRLRVDNGGMAPVKKPKPSLGEHYLRAWRDFHGISQEDAAAAINVERGTLSKIENAKVPYQQQYIEGLAKLYKCSPAALIGTDPSSEPTSPEGRLRSALLGFGVNAVDLGRAISSVKVFVDDLDELQSLDPLDDRSEPASPRRAKVPSR